MGNALGARRETNRFAWIRLIPLLSYVHEQMSPVLIVACDLMYNRISLSLSLSHPLYKSRGFIRTEEQTNCRTRFHGHSFDYVIRPETIIITKSRLIYIYRLLLSPGILLCRYVLAHRGRSRIAAFSEDRATISLGNLYVFSFTQI